ncbi:MAG: class II glutamine amidotransferase [Deltaproteobacteria bacterium]|nr:class II glutamine amidotransferase [Deltaproteobacteria bacterium]
MGRLVGYMANRHDRLGAALHQERAVVAPPPAMGPTGWGLGFYQGGEVLHKKRPQFDGKFDWETVTRDVRSDCAILHLRQPTVGDFRSHNTHPFRMRSWLFAHTGTISRFEAIEERLRGSLPDFVNRNIRGKTDSEVLFHVILSFLHDSGNLDNLDVASDDLLSAVRSAVALVDRLTAEVKAPPSTMNLVLTNGRLMIGLCRGARLAYVERRGLFDPPDDLPPDRGAPGVLRYVMLTSDLEGIELPADYIELEQGQAVIVDRDLHVQGRSL